jgi:Flp pilus assembly protein TadG
VQRLKDDSESWPAWDLVDAARQQLDNAADPAAPAVRQIRGDFAGPWPNKAFEAQPHCPEIQKQPPRPNLADQLGKPLGHDRFSGDQEFRIITIAKPDSAGPTARHRPTAVNVCPGDAKGADPGLPNRRGSRHRLFGIVHPLDRPKRRVVRPRQDERGAASVVVALLMVPLIGFAAVAIDVAAMYAERQQLQTGADAGALAIAQDCGRGTCGVVSQTAQALATSNLENASSQATVTALSATQVTVRNTGIKQHLFAGVLGIDSTVLTASATAAWGSPNRGTAPLPLVFSWCEWQAQTRGGLLSGTTDRVIVFPEESDTGCIGPTGTTLPPGFGWLDTDPGTCETTSAIADRIGSSTDGGPPTGCTPAGLVARQGQTVVLPLFDGYSGKGNNATYQIHGYAAFTITGYYFGGQYNWGSPCGGDDRCIRGYFTRVADLTNTFAFGPNAPQLGASIVRLTQ